MIVIIVRSLLSVLLVHSLVSCTSIGNLKYHRPGSDDPLVYGGTRLWLENDNFIFWTQGMWVIGPFYPILYVIPLGDLLLSTVLDTVLLPLTVPWALSESFSSATISNRFDQLVERRMAECADMKQASSNSYCLEASLKLASPLDTEEGRYATALNIPSPIDASKVYKPGITSDEYFEQLCRSETGEFIYKTVENVDGIFQMRWWPQITYHTGHLYASEDPYGLIDSGVHPYMFGGKFGYLFIETPRVVGNQSIGNSGHKYILYETNYRGTHWQVVPTDAVNSLKSRYGFTWRGIKFPHDRDLGIAGSEVIVLDLKTEEILGVFRGFSKFDFNARRSHSGTGMSWGKRCPTQLSNASRGVQKEFVMKVLKPRQYSKP